MKYKIKAKITPQSKYQPIRYAQARATFLESAIQTLSNDCSPSEKIVFNFPEKNKEETFECFEQGRIKDIKVSTSGELFPFYLRMLYEEVTKFYYSSGTKNYNFVKNLLKEYNNDDYLVFLHYSSLIFNGNNIFNFDTKLLKVFEVTDVDNVYLKDIRLPFPTIYLHFGKQEDKKIYGDIKAIITVLTKDKASPKQKKDIFFLLDKETLPGSTINKHQRNQIIPLLIVQVLQVDSTAV